MTREAIEWLERERPLTYDAARKHYMSIVDLDEDEVPMIQTQMFSLKYDHEAFHPDTATCSWCTEAKELIIVD